MNYSIINLLFQCAVAASFSSLLTSVARADAKIYNLTLQSTAGVLAKSDGQTSSGTGVLVNAEKKLLISNFHVVGNARTAVIFAFGTQR